MKQLAYLVSLLLIFVIPFENTVEVRSVGTISRFIGLLAAAIWLLAVVVEGDFRRPSLFVGLVTAFVAWSCLSLFWSIDPVTTVEFAFTYIQLLVFVLLLWDLYRTTPAIRAGLQAYVLGAWVAIGSLLFNLALGRHGAVNRYTVGGFNADHAGLLLAIGMPIAWGLALLMASQRRGGILRWLNLAYMPLAFLGIALTATRTALITTIPAIVFAIASLGRLSMGRRCSLVFSRSAGSWRSSRSFPRPRSSDFSLRDRRSRRAPSVVADTSGRWDSRRMDSAPYSVSGRAHSRPPWEWERWPTTRSSRSS